jgi:hypothetical protein
LILKKPQNARAARLSDKTAQNAMKPYSGKGFGAKKNKSKKGGFFMSKNFCLFFALIDMVFIK